MLQVKMISSHQCAAGTAKWMDAVGRHSSLAHNRQFHRLPTSPHAAAPGPSPPNMAMTPSPSHTQFPYHDRPMLRTRNGVGTADKGFAIRM